MLALPSWGHPEEINFLFLGKFLSIFLKLIYLFQREWGREEQREKERENVKQTPAEGRALRGLSRNQELVT